ncbi:hypothetical protein N9A45_01975 [bacterium]|nr:hypothetical protein [bacterium]
MIAFHMHSSLFIAGMVTLMWIGYWAHGDDSVDSKIKHEKV